MGNSSQRVNWQDDDEVSHCPGCNEKFTVFLRKHHCRNCGMIFCKACSRDADPSLLPSSDLPPGKKIRICSICLPLDPNELFWIQAEEDFEALAAGINQLKMHYTQNSHPLTLTKVPKFDRIQKRLDEISQSSIGSDDLATYENFLEQLQFQLKEKDQDAFTTTLKIAKKKSSMILKKFKMKRIFGRRR